MKKFIRCTIAVLALVVGASALAVLPSTDIRTDLVAGGGTTFTFNFKVYEASSVEVFLNGVKQALGFTVALNANQDTTPGGTVTFLVAPVNGVVVRIQRTVALTQLLALNPSSYPAKSIEKAHDRSGMWAQQLQQQITDLAAGTLPPSADGSAFLVAGRSLSQRFSDEVNVKDAPFGAKGDSSADDTAALQAALDYASAIGQRKVVVPPGAYRYTSPITLPQNTTLVGSGPKFGTVLIPDGCAAFLALGATRPGGDAFRIYVRDLTIQPINTPAATKLIEINKGYSIHFDHVWLYGVADNGSIGFWVKDVNDFLLSSVVVYGASNSSPYGLVVEGAVWGRLIDPDFEALKFGIANYASDGQIDIFAPYMERNIVGIANYGGYGSRTTIYGGVIAGVNDSTIPIADYASANSTLVFGTHLPTGTGIVPFYAVAGWSGMFYDGATRRLQIGPTGTNGAVSPGYSITVNPSGTEGSQYGIGVGPYVQYVGAPDAYDGDWVFLTTTGDKTARFIGSGPSRSLSIYTDGVAIADQGMTIGVSGAPISSSLRATLTADIASITAGSCSDQPVSMPNAAVGAECAVGLPSAAPAGLIADAFVASLGTVTLRLCASNGASAVDPPSLTYSVRCFNP